MFCLLAVLDQLAKIFAKNIFKNFQFAFSLPVPVWLIYVINFAVLFFIINYVKKHYKILSGLANFAWLLIFSGAVLNIAERIVLGYVRDFIYISFYQWTGVYNLADFYIILGIMILLLPKTYHLSPKT